MSAVQTDDGIVWSIFGLSEIDRGVYRGKVLTPEINRAINRSKVLTPKIDREIDRNKVLGTEVGFFEKSRKWTKKKKKRGEKKKYTLKMEPLGKYLTFRNRP